VKHLRRPPIRTSTALLATCSVLTLACAGALLCGEMARGAALAAPSPLVHVHAATARPRPMNGSGSEPAETVLYSFQAGGDAIEPFGNLIADATGALYGTSVEGGGGPCNTAVLGYDGCGAVFKLTPTASGYAESVIYPFQAGNDGDDPQSGLLADSSGALYGTTVQGGGSKCKRVHAVVGCGTVYKLTPTASGYTESVLYRFHGKSDGAAPLAALIAGAGGRLYGVTDEGGDTPCQDGCGTVFALTPSASGYTESILYRFAGGTDGSYPIGGLIAGSGGALYGTTGWGGSTSACPGSRDVHIEGCGVVFKLTPTGSGYTESILYRFQGGSDGNLPTASLIADASGALYGTTVGGGVSKCGDAYGCGTVFKLAPSGSSYLESILYRFRGDRRDGSDPSTSLTAGANGVLYGTTTFGGTSFSCPGAGKPRGCGTVFALTPSGSGYTESILHHFQGGDADGAHPYASVLLMNGNLFGTTYTGGTGPCGPGECGTVYELSP